MRRLKFLLSLVAVVAILAMQVGFVFAAPATQEGFITGTVTAITCETDVNTGVVTFLVTLDLGDGTTQTVRIDQATAEALELIYLNEDGSPDCTPESLAESIGWEVSIDPANVIPDVEEPQHPVGGALATFFEDITDYDTIMEAHANGFGFGVIAQALWMVQKVEGDSDVFLAILDAKKSGDFSEFTFEDGTSPTNWGQFRKAVMGGEKGNLGIVMSGKEKPNDHGNNGNNGNQNNNGNGKDKDKDKDKDKGNNGNGNDK